MATASHLQRAYESLQSKVRNMRENSEAIMGESIALIETAGAGGLASYARARLGEDGHLLVGGVDAELLAGLALHGVAFMGGFGKYDEHAHAIGTGFVTCWTVHKMYELGIEAKNEAASTSGVVKELPPRTPRVTDSVFDQNWAAAA